MAGGHGQLYGEGNCSGLGAEIGNDVIGLDLLDLNISWSVTRTAETRRFLSAFGGDLRVGCIVGEDGINGVMGDDVKSHWTGMRWVFWRERLTLLGGFSTFHVFCDRYSLYCTTKQISSESTQP